MIKKIPSTKSVDRKPKNFNILIVEDELNARRELGELMEHYGYSVSLAFSGRDAVTKVSKKKGEFDIILMDIIMPGEIDGIEAAREIQALYDHIPIILLTAYTENPIYEQRVREADLKIFGWVDKPIIGDNEKKIVELIEEQIKKQKNESDL